MTYSAGRVVNMTLNSSPLISAINYFPLGGAESWLLGANATGTASYIRTIDLNSRIAQYSTPTGYRALTFDNASRINVIGNYACLEIVARQVDATLSTCPSRKSGSAHTTLRYFDKLSTGGAQSEREMGCEMYPCSAAKNVLSPSEMYCP